MCKNYRIFNSHPDHLSFVDFNTVDAAIKHYRDGISRGMSYVFIVTNVDELEKIIPNSIPQCEPSGNAVSI